MDTLKQLLGTLAPFIGTALGGPLGGAAASALCGALGITPDSKPADIQKALVGATPEQIAAITNAENDFKLKMVQLGYDHEEKLAALTAGGISDVNKTIQTEATSDHWPTYSWRPFIGFSFGCYITALWILPMAGKTPVLLSPDITMTVGAILGIASYFRGKMQADPNIPTDNRG